VAVAREVVLHQTSATPTAILGLLPPTSASIATLYGALRRGLFRGAPRAALQAAQIHLQAHFSAGLLPGSSAATDGIAASALPLKRGPKSAKASAADTTSMANANAESGLHMLGDLLRCDTCLPEDDKSGKSAKRHQRSSLPIGTSNPLNSSSIGERDEGGDDEGLSSEFEDVPTTAAKRSKHDADVGVPNEKAESGGDVADALQRFKHQRGQTQKKTNWAY